MTLAGATARPLRYASTVFHGPFHNPLKHKQNPVPDSGYKVVGAAVRSSPFGEFVMLNAIGSTIIPLASLVWCGAGQSRPAAASALPPAARLVTIHLDTFEMIGLPEHLRKLDFSEAMDAAAAVGSRPKKESPNWPLLRVTARMQTVADLTRPVVMQTGTRMPLPSGGPGGVRYEEVNSKATLSGDW
jgi:hypothetical protein